MHRLFLIAAGAMALAFALQPHVGKLSAGAPAPLVDQSIVATYRADAITLTGTGFGSAPQSRAVLIDYGGRSATILGDSPLVDLWDSTEIELRLPWEVTTGQLRVVVDGVSSDYVDVRVYEYQAFSMPPTVGTDSHELALAVDYDGAVWVNQEFHRELHSVQPAAQTAVTAMSIPQAPGQGIFASTLGGGDWRSQMSALGEDIVVDDTGKVWFTEGGMPHYSGSYFNTSRIVRYDPDLGSFDCFNVPSDNSRVTGVLVDPARSLVWYTESSFSTGGAISAFDPSATESDCLFDPYGSQPRPQVCDGEIQGGCHLRYPLDNPYAYPAHLALDGDGNVWFTEYWGDAVARLDPESGQFLEFPLPVPTVTTYPGIVVGPGPWELEFDASGLLWISEFFDASVVRLDPSQLGLQDCLHLDADGQNPCTDEVLIASNGSDGKVIHTVSVGPTGEVWFGVSQEADGQRGTDAANVGVVLPERGDAVLLLPGTEEITSVSGVAMDSSTGDVWIAQYWQHRVGRIHLVESAVGDVIGCSEDGPSVCGSTDSDGDGCTDAEELGPDAQFGGQRDPNNFWDFFDTPDLSGYKDGGVTLPGDILGVVMRLGSDDRDGTAAVNRFSDPLAPPLDVSSYHPGFDRTFPANGNPYDLGPPDGSIGLSDVLAVVLQYSQRCVGPGG